MAAALASSSPAQAECIRSQNVMVDRGTSPAGVPWVIRAGIRNSGSCPQRPAFAHSFRLGDRDDRYSGWSGLSGLSNGHISRRYPINAHDFRKADPYEGSFSGFVGGRVVRLVARMSTGEFVTIRPAKAPRRLRERYWWLRDPRFFFTFHPVDRVVRVVSLYGRRGNLIYRVGNDGTGMFY